MIHPARCKLTVATPLQLSPRIAISVAPVNTMDTTNDSTSDCIQSVYSSEQTNAFVSLPQHQPFAIYEGSMPCYVDAAQYHELHDQDPFCYSSGLDSSCSSQSGDDSYFFDGNDALPAQHQGQGSTVASPDVSSCPPYAQQLYSQHTPMEHFERASRPSSLSSQESFASMPPSIDQRDCYMRPSLSQHPIYHPSPSMRPGLEGPGSVDPQNIAPTSFGPPPDINMLDSDHFGTVRESASRPTQNHAPTVLQPGFFGGPGFDSNFLDCKSPPIF